MSKKLTDKQERFCIEYVIDFNATQAAIRSGYSEKTAGAIASENLSKDYIAERIDELNVNRKVLKIQRTKAQSVKIKKRKVYLIRFGDTKFYKIGTSMNIPSRIKSMNGASPIDLHLICQWYVKDSFECEKVIHHKFDNVRHKFEWFNLEGMEESTILNEINEVVESFKSRNK